MSAESFVAFASKEAYVTGRNHRTAALEQSRLCLSLTKSDLPT